MELYNIDELQKQISEEAELIKNIIQSDPTANNLEHIKNLIPLVDSLVMIDFLKNDVTTFSFAYSTKKSNFYEQFILNLSIDSDGFTRHITKDNFNNLLESKPTRFRYSDEELEEHRATLTLSPVLTFLPDVLYYSCYYAIKKFDNTYENIVEFENISDWLDWIDRDCKELEPLISPEIVVLDNAMIGSGPPALSDKIEGRMSLPNAVGVDACIKRKFNDEKANFSKLKPRFAFLETLDLNEDLGDLTEQQQRDFEYIYNIMFAKEWEHAMLQCLDFECGVITDSDEIVVIEVEDEFSGAFMYQNVEELVDNVRERNENN